MTHAYCIYNLSSRKGSRIYSINIIRSFKVIDRTKFKIIVEKKFSTKIYHQLVQLR